MMGHRVDYFIGRVTFNHGTKLSNSVLGVVGGGFCFYFLCFI